MSLGEPDEASRDETELWYIASKIKAILILGDRGGEIKSDYIHVIRFDRNGFVETLQLYNSATSSGAMRAEPVTP